MRMRACFSGWLLISLISNLLLPAVQAAPDSPFSQGEYQDELMHFDCPEDQGYYGDDYEGQYEKATHYCGQDVPAGYWRYHAPQWHIYRTLMRKPELERARVGGKYLGLIDALACPSETAQEKQDYGDFDDYGWEPASDYCGRHFPAAYWVWVAPKWYLWRSKDISAIGFVAQEQHLQLGSTDLKLRFEYAQGHEAWAQQTLEHLSLGLKTLESWSGLAFRGTNPYLIEEHPNFELLGMAGRHKMQLASPPRGTPWTLLHEMIHIWNVNVTPLWFNEGQANFISYLLVRQLHFAFVAPETLPQYLSDWEKIQGTDQDLPLQGHYEALPQGKAMAFWKLLYELGGPELIRDCFRYSVEHETVSMDALREILHRHLPQVPPEDLLSGWVLPGPYLIHNAQELGPVAHPLSAESLL